MQDQNLKFMVPKLPLKPSAVFVESKPDQTTQLPRPRALSLSLIQPKPSSAKAVRLELEQLSKQLGAMRKQAVAATTSSPRKLLDAKQRRYDALLEQEARLARQIFYQPTNDCRFFMLKTNVWLYYADGQIIRYESRSEGVFKKVGDSGYHHINGKELLNFIHAVRKYTLLSSQQIYT